MHPASDNATSCLNTRTDADDPRRPGGATLRGPTRGGGSMCMTWQSDAELFVLARRELFPAVVGEVMDTLGLRRQFLPPAIRPLGADMVVIGRAMPVLDVDIA